MLRRRRLWLLALSILAPAARAAAPPPTGSPPIAWVVALRGTGLATWKIHLTAGPTGDVWLGGSGTARTPAVLWHGRDGAWSAVREPRFGAVSRTYVFDLDPGGQLWAAPYLLEPQAYRSLWHLDGTRWLSYRTPPLRPQAMSMLSAHEGWIAGNGARIVHFQDGQLTLEKVRMPREVAEDARDLMAIQVTPAGGWAAGMHGLVLRRGQGEWEPLRPPPELADAEFYDLDTTADGTLWLVGANGVIARFQEGSWEVMESQTRKALMGIDMVSPVDGWAVGFKGTLLHFDGARWNPQPPPVQADLYDIAMTSARDGWIAGDDLVLEAKPRGAFWLSEAAVPGSEQLAGATRRVAALDVDGDGDLDLFSQSFDSPHLFENRGAAGFSALPFPRLPGGLGDPYFRNSAWGDADGDGDLDLAVLTEAPGILWLYRNQGGGRFAPPIQLPAPLSDGRDHTVYFADVDRDGDLDLYLAMSSQPGPKSAANILLQNDGAGHFRRRVEPHGESGMEMLALWGELDGKDGPDVLLPGYRAAETTLLANDGTGHFRDVTAGSGFDTLPGEGQVFQGFLADLDGDGTLDAFLLAHRVHALVNDGRGHFKAADGALFADPLLIDSRLNNPGFKSTLSNAGDLDLDGRPELLMMTRGSPGTFRTWLLSQSGGAGRYVDLAAQVGLASLEGQGAAFADWDGDGDLDLWIAGDTGSHLLVNNTHGSFLKVRLRGRPPNRFAFGAEVRVYRAGRLGRPDGLLGVQQMGAGFNPTGGQALTELVFGLAGQRACDVEVRFPSGRRVVERGVAANRVITVYELPRVLDPWAVGANFLRRAALSTDLGIEAGKLALAAILLALGRGPLARRLGARSFVPRWGWAVALLIAYLATAVALAEAGRAPATHGLQLAALAVALLLLLAADGWLSRRRDARHLGPYRLLALLGEGGMGVVYRARHAVTGKVVALKVLPPQRLEREEDRRRFLREGQILGRLEHPNIVRVFETGEIAGRGFLSLELLEGRSLARHLAARGALPGEAVRLILLVLAGALAYIHRRGIVHRDVKCENIYLLDGETDWPVDEAGFRRRVRLMDFGLAEAAALETLTPHRAWVGTLAYLAPEVLDGGRPDARSDLYSLGVVGFEALTGRRPFVADEAGPLLARIQQGDRPTVAQLRPDVPPALARLVERLLARRPAERPAAADEVALALERAGGEPEGAGWTPRGVDSVVEIAAGEDEASAAPGAPDWEMKMAEARRHLDQGRTTAAEVAYLEGLALLRQALSALDAGERERYGDRHGVAQALELGRRLSLG